MNGISAAKNPGIVSPPVPMPVSVESELQIAFDLLVSTGSYIEGLESSLRSVTYLTENGEGSGEQTTMVVPQLVERLRGLNASIRTYNRRLSDLQSRLALE